MTAVAVIDAGGANFGSVCYALERLGVQPRIVRDADGLRGVSVSYTHLDVYKRQVLAGPAQPFADARADLADLLLRRMDGVLRIRDSKLLMFQAPREAVNELLQLLPDAEPPTVCAVDGADTLALQALCHGAMTWQRLEDLKRAGARGLMVLPVERMLA